MRSGLLRAVIAVMIVFRLGAAVAASEVRGAEVLVWPPAPAPARIEFVKTFSSATDLGISRTFFERIADFLFGPPDSTVHKPMAVVARGGLIHVGDPGAGGVHRFDTAHGRYTLVKGPKGARLPSPVGLAVDAAGVVYVADSVLARVFVIRPGADEAAPLALAATLKQPTAIAVAPDGRLYVVDTTAHVIRVFAANGDALATIGGRGTGPGEFNYPTHIALGPQGRILVNDALNYRIQVFDAAGHFVSAFGRHGDGTGDAARQKGVAVDRYGHIYVADALLHAVQIFDEAGRLLLPVGEQGQQPGEFWLPTGLFIDRDDHDTIYVADSFNQRVQVLRYIGGAD
jgi:DNA-binding beta-propeller fold protein YncE